MKERANLTVYGGEGCQQCKVVRMLLDGRNIPYEYVDVFEDKAAQHYLINKCSDYSVPKIGYGRNVFNYSPKNMEKVFKDFA